MGSSHIGELFVFCYGRILNLFYFRINFNICYFANILNFSIGNEKGMDSRYIWEIKIKRTGSFLTKGRECFCLKKQKEKI